MVSKVCLVCTNIMINSNHGRIIRLRMTFSLPVLCIKYNPSSPVYIASSEHNYQKYGYGIEFE